MRKVLCLVHGFLLALMLAMPVFAATQTPQILLQPQSPNYQTWAVAEYTVKTDTAGMKATWHMQWQGKEYDLSKKGDWEAFAGETYGATTQDSKTFTYFFGGIEEDLDGAYIWCVLKGSGKTLTSQKVRISVGNENPPPQILDIPTQLTVEQGDLAELRCVAKSPDGSQLTFLWYETATGKLEDMTAVNRGTETADYILCETDQIGTRNYLCMVQTEKGGVAYSSIVPVTVTKKQVVVAPKPTQETTPSTAPTPPTTIPETTQETTPKTLPTTTPTTTPTTVPIHPTTPSTPVGFPWWGYLLIVAAAIGGGIGTAILLTKKK